MKGPLKLMLSLGYSQGKSTIKWNPTAYKKYEYGHLRLWYIKLTLCKRFLNWNKILCLKKVVTGKPTFFVIDVFCAYRSILTMAFDMAVLYGNDAFSILVLSTKKWYYSYLKKIFIFQKICFIVKVLKSFQISTDCHIKTCQHANLPNGVLF